MSEHGGIRKIYVKGKSPTKKPIVRLPWPRNDEEGTPLGVDVEAKRQDIIKLTYKYYRVPGIPMEELLQEIFMTILHKNRGNSAHNPTKSSFGHYVCMIANNVCINFVNKKKRLEREKDSIDSNFYDGDERTFLDTYEAPETNDDSFNDKMESVEVQMRLDGQWELARYTRAARSGSKPDVVREALTWGERNITTKYIRDLRDQVDTYINC